MVLLTKSKGKEYGRLYEAWNSPREMLLDGFKQRDRSEFELEEFADRRKVFGFLLSRSRIRLTALSLQGRRER